MKQEAKNKHTINFQGSFQYKSMGRGKYFPQMLLKQLIVHMEKRTFGIYFKIIIRKLHYNKVFLGLHLHFLF